MQLAPLREVIDAEEGTRRTVILRLECGHSLIRKASGKGKRVRCKQCFMQNVAAPIIQKAF
jgi:hypothetical protein